MARKADLSELERRVASKAELAPQARSGAGAPLQVSEGGISRSRRATKSRSASSSAESMGGGS